MRSSVLIVVVLALSGTVYAHDRNRPDLDGWFMTLQNKTKSPCCDGSDAMRLDDVDWESRDGHYRVRLEGEWVDVPDDAVIGSPNRAGPTMVWPYRKDGKLNQIRCFMLGAEG
jgi:hypothetical protein